ncbi:unnamed protein product, partial [marine sediment metagenome]
MIAYGVPCGAVVRRGLDPERLRKNSRREDSMTPDRHCNRRQFLHAAGLSAGGVAVPYWFTGANARADEFKSKNDRPHVAMVGVGGWGSRLVQVFAKYGEIVAVCDVDQRHAAKAKAALGGKPKVYEDYRKLLERNDIDVVANATPEHWHVPVCMDACRA